MLGKKELPVRKKKIFKDLAQMQQGETEVWKAAATSTILFARNAFLTASQDLKARPALDTISLHNAVVYDNFAYWLILNEFSRVHDVRVRFSPTFDSSHSSVSVPSIKRATLKVAACELLASVQNLVARFFTPF